MDVMDIVKNPIIIGLLAGLITYMYMRWKNDYYNKDKKKRKDINLLIPFSVFVVFWFISYAYFSNDNEISILPSNIEEHIAEIEKKPDLNLNDKNDIGVKIKTSVNKISETSDPVSFNLVSNGVHIPTSLPEILFEMN
jgi:hypothetical protein